LRIRIALTLGALVLAGGALTGGIAVASQSQPTSTTTARPTDQPTTAPTEITTLRPTPPPTAIPAPREIQTTKPAARPQRIPVPVAVPAGPTGDLHLPAIGVTR
jgi:hypothetical protein